MTEPSKSPPRFGFVAVIGPPNVGKSTFINRVVGSKVSIVTPKVQTTRTRVLGIMVHEQSQIAFIDTPGIFAPRKRLDRAMVDAAWSGSADADVTLLMVDASIGMDADVERILDGLASSKCPAVLVLNKIDLVKRETLLALSAALNERAQFIATFMISAADGGGIGDVLDQLAGTVPEGVWHFPEDQMSDMPLRLISAEVTREKIFLALRQEVPYSATVETEEWEDFDDGSVKISQTVYVERDTQKSIVLGKGGAMVKRISTEARTELAELFGRKVHLFLFVKVREKWMEDRARYEPWGLKFDA
ncbi:MAG: GTPase Era [Rhodospirillaceae bacterium]|nr:GTPase Era [Rhodospirillaceae bacterium]